MSTLTVQIDAEFDGLTSFHAAELHDVARALNDSVAIGHGMVTHDADTLRLTFQTVSPDPTVHRDLAYAALAAGCTTQTMGAFQGLTPAVVTR